MITSNESMDFNDPKEFDDHQLFDDPQLFDSEAAPTADSYAHSKIVTSTTIYVYNIKLKLCTKRMLAVRE